MDKKSSSNFRDLTGQVFGRWTALACSHRARYPGDQTRWHCRCECGNEKIDVRYCALTGGGSNSCGCLRKELAHGKAGIRSLHKREYTIWMGMKTRCYNERHPTYERYGARGIKLAPEWEKSFAAFIKHMGPANGGTIERIDNDGDYEPGNCRWVPRPQQSRNRRNSLLVQWNGRECILVDVAREENVEYMCLRQRFMKKGVSLKEAVDYCKAEGHTFRERAVTPSYEEPKDWC